MQVFYSRLQYDTTRHGKDNPIGTD